MITNVNLLSDALRLVGVMSSIDTIDQEDADLGLRTLNEMMDDWQERGIKVGWSPQSSFSAVAPLEDDVIPAVKYVLAMTLCAYYGKEPKPSIAANAARLYLRVLRQSMLDQMRPVNITNIPMPIRRGFYSIVNW